MKLWRLIVLAAALPMLFSCGGGGVPGGGFSYGKKFQGSWMDKDTYRSSDFYIQLDEQGNIVSAQSYASQGAKCSIAGSVFKNGSFLNLTVQLTVDEGNAVCTNVALSASGQLTFDRETGWWTGNGTGTFSDAPNSQRSIGFSLTRDDDW